MEVLSVELGAEDDKTNGPILQHLFEDPTDIRKAVLLQAQKKTNYASRDIIVPIRVKADDAFYYLCPPPLGSVIQGRDNFMARSDVEMNQVFSTYNR